MGAGASLEDHAKSIHGNLDQIEETLVALDDPDIVNKFGEEERQRVLERIQQIHDMVADKYFGGSPGKTRPNKTKAEELIDEVEMEAAVDDEINTLLFEFVEVYSLGDEDVDERVVALFSRPEFCPSVVDSFGNSLVVKGIQEDNDSFVQLALNFGVDPNLCNSGTFCVLFFFPDCNSPISSSSVLSFPFPFPFRCSAGVTALHLVCYCGMYRS